MKIKITYQIEQEVAKLLELLKPMLQYAKIKKSQAHPPYKHIYIEFVDKCWHLEQNNNILPALAGVLLTYQTEQEADRDIPRIGRGSLC